MYTSKYRFVSLASLALCLLLSSCSYQVAAQSFFNETAIERRKPPFPSRQQCLDALRPGCPPKDKTVYWTGLPTSSFTYFMHLSAIDYWADEYDFATFSDERLWDPPLFTEKSQYSGTKDQSRQFTDHAVEAFSRGTQGKVYLFMPYDTAPYVNGRFWNIEWPIFRDGGLVTEILWVDTKYLGQPELLPEPQNVPRVWWKKGDARPATVPEGVSLSPPQQSASAVTLSTRSTSAGTSTGTLTGTSTDTSAGSSATTTKTTSAPAQGLKPGFFNRPKSRASTSAPTSASTSIPISTSTAGSTTATPTTATKKKKPKTTTPR